MTRLTRSLAAVGLAFVLAGAGFAVDAAGPVPEAHPSGSLAGRFLVATPDLEDPNFDHTVVFLIHHDASGAMGLVINRVVAQGPLDELLEGLGLETRAGNGAEIRVHYGGPVEQGRAFVLHSSDYRNAGTVTLADGIAMTSSLDVLEDIAAGRGPRQRMLAVGYAGWAPDQLETELAAGAWITVPADPALLFDDDVASKWERAMERRGIEL